MLLIGILLLLILFLTALLLFLPLWVKISSNTKQASLRMPLVAEGHLSWAEEEPEVVLRILFWKKKWELSRLLAIAWEKRTKGTKTERKPKSKRLTGKLKKNWLGVLGSFRRKAFYVYLDTGDDEANAFLYPLFEGVNQRFGTSCQINFMGENTIELDWANRLFRMLRALLK